MEDTGELNEECKRKPMGRDHMLLHLPFRLGCFILAVALLYGCGSDNANPYLEKLNDPDNGLMKSVAAKGIRFTMKYLPPEYQLDQQHRDPSTRATDSSGAGYRSSLSFLLSIAPEDEEHGDDIMLRDVSSPEGLTSRSIDLNFAIREMLVARYDGKDVAAVLATMENVYGLSKKKDVMVVFPRLQDHWKADGDLELIFDDRVFHTGNHHFRFRIHDLEQASLR